MALIQMRTPGGSYSDVDEAVVADYEAQGWVRTTDLPEFQGTNVVKYNPDKTVTMADGSTEEAYKAVNYYTPNENAQITTGSGDNTGTTGSSIDYGFGTGLSIARGIYGFMPEAVINEFAKAWSKTGNADLAIAATRQTKPWKDSFGYLLRDDGSLVMSELDAVATIATYKSTLSEIGITDFKDFENQFKQLITSEVSGLEFQQRIDTVYSGVVEQIPEVEALFRDRYGIALDQPTIFGALINPDIQDKVLAGEIKTLQLQAQAEARGFSTTFSRFDELRKLGLTQEKAATLYESAQDIMQSARGVGRTLDITTLEEAAIGDIESRKEVEAAAREAISESAFITGSRKKGDRITGLTTR